SSRFGAADDDDNGDPWRSRVFFPKVSDSVHSTCVSISDQDLDLMYNDEIHLALEVILGFL
ncbi:hypothetical protein PanWU01x14_286740, partial [Parasponia andersonii]